MAAVLPSNQMPGTVFPFHLKSRNSHQYLWIGLCATSNKLWFGSDTEQELLCNIQLIESDLGLFVDLIFLENHINKMIAGIYHDEFIRRNES